MSVDETKTICRLHIEFVKQQEEIFEQYEKILDNMSNSAELLKRKFTEKYQKLVNDGILEKAVVKYSTLLAAFEQYQVKYMDWYVKPKKILRPTPSRAKAFKAKKEQERMKQKEQDKEKEKQT